MLPMTAETSPACPDARALDGALLHAIHHAEGRHQFAAGMDRNGELAAGGFGDGLGKDVGCTENRVERLGEARCQAPANGSALSVDSRRNARGQYTGHAGIFDKGTTIHERTPSVNLKE